ncbi:hypothetical protein [Nonomuraea insulae]|uniref:Uncharacterized protein n=1 Tax=Nonomuraea insulae TaxID=1616787 RepID=A0ABW1CMG0_9ACTN
MDARILDAWLDSLNRLFRIPPEFRDETVEWKRAGELLGGGEPLLKALVDHGLPYSDSSGQIRFDRYDLTNLALYSGSGTSGPEMAMKYALRWMHDAPETLYTPRRWTFAIETSCPHPEGCGDGDRSWNIARPRPGVYGGRTESLTMAPDGSALDAVMVSDGAQRTLRSARLREIALEYSEGYRWIQIPEQLQRRSELLLPHGFLPCIPASLDLAEKCRAAGFEARTRRGWILGMLDIAHSWLEVIDEDGQLKTVDPAFLVLARDHAEKPHPGFREACLGSLMNRLMPTDHEADNPVLQHECRHGWSIPDSKTAIRLSRAA